MKKKKKEKLEGGLQGVVMRVEHEKKERKKNKEKKEKRKKNMKKKKTNYNKVSNKKKI